MKRLSLYAMISLVLLLGQTGLLAQNADEQRLVVPLSDAGQPARLHVSLMSGRIEVTAYQGQEVIVVARPHSTKEKEKIVDGMRRIPNTSIGLTVEEDDNVIQVGADWTNRGIDIEIQVPARTSAYLSTINNGDIVVNGLTGELELENTNGAITATEISGSVVADTTNGPVRVTFVEIDAEKEMAFASFNGNVDVTFPPGLRADLRISSGQGDIFTDFDAEVQPRSPVVERGEDGGRYQVRVQGDVHVKIGGGGPVYRFKTLNGNVYVRKAGG